MRIALTELLKSREIVFPTVVDRVEYAGGNLSMRIRGWPWWKPGTEDKEGLIEFVFEEISSGSICVANLSVNHFDGDEALEDFDVRPIADFEWARPAIHSIYCASPLTEPLAVYVTVHDYLAGLDADFSAESFLNCARSLRKFIEITSSASYLLANAPDAVRDVICGELDRQGVRYSVISHNQPIDQRLRVQFGVTSFLCARAFAQYN